MKVYILWGIKIGMILFSLWLRIKILRRTYRMVTITLNEFDVLTPVIYLYDAEYVITQSAQLCFQDIVSDFLPSKSLVLGGVFEYLAPRRCPRDLFLYLFLEEGSWKESYPWSN